MLTQLASRPLLLALSLAALLSVLPIAEPAAQGRAERGYQVVVHPSNPLREVERQFLRDAFLKRAVAWHNEVAIRPVDLSRELSARQRFSREVLGKSVAEVKRYWYQLIFSGKGVPPPEVSSEAAAVAHVLRHPGGVAYLSPGADPGGAKVLVVK